MERPPCNRLYQRVLGKRGHRYKNYKEAGKLENRFTIIPFLRSRISIDALFVHLPSPHLHGRRQFYFYINDSV